LRGEPGEAWQGTREVSTETTGAPRKAASFRPLSQQLGPRVNDLPELARSLSVDTDVFVLLCRPGNGEAMSRRLKSMCTPRTDAKRCENPDGQLLAGVLPLPRLRFRMAAQSANGQPLRARETQSESLATSAGRNPRGTQSRDKTPQLRRGDRIGKWNHPWLVQLLAIWTLHARVLPPATLAAKPCATVAISLRTRRSLIRDPMADKFTG